MGIRENSLKKFFFAVCISILWISCSTSRKAVVPEKTGSTVAPLPADTVAIVKETPVPVSKKGKLVVSLLLPLQLKSHFTNDTLPDTAPLIIADALPGLNFLEGAMLVRDELSQQQIELEITITDTGFDSLETVKTLKQLEFQHTDAIVSLLPSGYNTLLATQSDRWGVPVYFFQSFNTQLLENHPFLRLAVPSNNTQIRQMALFLAGKYPASNFIAVYREQRKENDIANLFAAVIDSARGSISCTKLNYKSDGWNALKSKLQKGKRNLLIIPTTDESFLASVLNRLDEVKTDYSFMLCGMPGWENFYSIDPLVMKELNTVIFNGLFIETDAEPVIAFRKKFIEIYHADPFIQAYLAHDILSFIAFDKFQQDISGSSMYTTNVLSGLKNKEMFRPIGQGGGMENKTVNVVGFDDYKLILLK